MSSSSNRPYFVHQLVRPSEPSQSINTEFALGEMHRMSYSTSMDNFEDAAMSLSPQTDSFATAKTSSRFLSGTQQIPCSLKTTSSIGMGPADATSTKPGKLGWEVFGVPLRLSQSCNANAFPSWPQRTASLTSFQSRVCRPASLPLTAQDALARMDRGVSVAFLQQLPSHISVQRVMEQLEAQSEMGAKVALARHAEKQEELDRILSERIRARRGKLAEEEVSGLDAVRDRTWVEQLDEDVAAMAEMEEKEMQSASWEALIWDSTSDDHFDNARAMEDGRAKTKLHWTSLPKPTRTQGQGFNGVDGRAKTVSPYPDSIILTPGYYEDVPVEQYFTVAESPSELSLPPPRFPYSIRPVTPILTGPSSIGESLFPCSEIFTSREPEVSGITFFPSYSDVNVESPVYPVPAPLPSPPASSSTFYSTLPDPQNEQEPGATNMTFFADYETLALSLNLSSDPVDRSAADSPCSTLPAKTSYSPSDCKRNCDKCGDMCATYQLGPCLCDKCRPNDGEQDADARETDLSLIAATPTQSTWSAWWAAITPFTRPTSPEDEAKFRPSLPISPMLPQEQELMLSPDLGNGSFRYNEHWKDDEQQREDEARRTRTRQRNGSRWIVEMNMQEMFESEFPLPELPV